MASDHDPAADAALRHIGFTAKARDFPRDELAYRMICAFCGYDPDKAPEGMRFFPNASVKAAWERVAAVAVAYVEASSSHQEKP